MIDSTQTFRVMYHLLSHNAKSLREIPSNQRVSLSVARCARVFWRVTDSVPIHYQGSGTKCAAMLTREEIDVHNAKVKAFWDSVRPTIEAINKKTLKSIYKRVAREGIHVCAIGREFFADKLDAWPQPTFCSVGGAIYHRALVVLDRYDDDFRPRPGFVHLTMYDEAEILYDPSTSRMRVKLGDVTADFQSIHPPRFGIDQDDISSIEEILTSLRIEREEAVFLKSLEAHQRIKIAGTDGELGPGQTHLYDPEKPEGQRLTEMRKSLIPAGLPSDSRQASARRRAKRQS